MLTSSYLFFSFFPPQRCDKTPSLVWYSGTADIKHLDNDEYVKKAALLEFPGVVFKGVKSPRPYYAYRILAPKTKPGASNVTLRAETVVFTPKPFCRVVLEQMLSLDARAKPLHVAAVCDNMDTMFGADAYAHTGNEGMRKVMAAAAGLRGDAGAMMPGFIHASGGFKRYLYDAIIGALLTVGYREEDMLCLPAEDLPRLLRHVQENPARLCLSPCIPFRCANTLNVRVSKFSDGWKLPEMSKSGFYHAVSHMNASHTPLDAVIVDAYDKLKCAAARNRSTQMPRGDFVSSISAGARIPPPTAEAALRSLVRHGLVYDDGASVGLFENRAFELVIARSLKAICERALAAEDTSEQEWRAVLDGRTAGPICDEQLEAMRMHLTHPLLYVGGNAGSGKTQFLSHVAALHRLKASAKDGLRKDRPSLIGVTFMCMPAVHLQVRVCGDQAMTCHHLIALHACTCPRSPFVDKGAATACPLEELEVLIVDELSVIYNEIFAVLLSMLHKCAKALRRIVLVGDHRQLVSVKEGNLLADIMAGLPWATKEFVHNHRVSDDAFALIRTNSDFIAQGVFSSLRFDDEAVILREPAGPANTDCDEALSHVLRELNLPESSLHVVARTNDLRRSMCRVVERHYLQEEPWDKVFYVGRKFVIKLNDRAREIANNEILVLEMVWDEERPVTDPKPPDLPPGASCMRNGRRIVVHSSTKHHVPSGYDRFIVFRGHLYQDRLRVVRLDKDIRGRMVKAGATTIHAYQGAQTKCIIFASPYRAGNYDTRECLYTASTRAEQAVVYITSKAALQTMCANREPHRNTGLAALLREHLGGFEAACSERLGKLVPPSYGGGGSTRTTPCADDPIESSP